MMENVGLTLAGLDKVKKFLFEGSIGQGPGCCEVSNSESREHTEVG